MALQVFQLTANAVNISDNRKTIAPVDKDEFGKLLENAKNLTKKTTTDATQESKAKNNNNADALLMQLLNMLNINILWLNQETELNQQPLDLHTDLGDIIYNTKAPSDELNKYWQAIIAEFIATGDINPDTVEKFYSAIKEALPYNTILDVNLLRETIIEMLNSSNLNNRPSNSIVPEKYSSTGSGEKGSIVYENSDEDIKRNVVSDITENSHLKQTLGLAADDKSESQIVDDNFALDENSEDNQYQTQSDVSNHNSILSVHTQKTFVTRMDKFNPNINTISTKSPEKLDIYEQLTDKIKVALKGDVQEVKVRLKPDYLGDVLIKVISEKGKLKAELFVDNSQIRSILKAHAQEFRNYIRDQGYNFTEINVYKMADGFELGTFDHHSSGNKNFQGKKTRANFYGNIDQPLKTTATDPYSLWENVSNINYMA